MYKTSRNTKIQPNIYQVYDYLDLWVMSRATSEDEVLGNVVLEFVDAGLNDHIGGFQTVKTLDIWPLITLERIFPGFHGNIQDPIQSSTFQVPWRDCPHLVTKLSQLCDIEDSEAFYKCMDASITHLEMTAGDNTVRVTFVMKPDEWEYWMEDWTLAVEGVEAYRPFLYEVNDIVDSWGRKCGMDITNPRMFTYRLDETTPDEWDVSWLISRLTQFQKLKAERVA